MGRSASSSPSSLQGGGCGRQHREQRERSNGSCCWSASAGSCHIDRTFYSCQGSRKTCVVCVCGTRALGEKMENLTRPCHVPGDGGNSNARRWYCTFDAFHLGEECHGPTGTVTRRGRKTHSGNHSDINPATARGTVQQQWCTGVVVYSSSVAGTRLRLTIRSPKQIRSTYTDR